MGAGIGIAATVVVAVGACAGVGQCGSPGACVDVGQLLPWVMSTTSVDLGKGEEHLSRVWWVQTLSAMTPLSASHCILPSGVAHKCAVRPWPSYLTNLCFSVQNCKMLLTVIPGTERIK